MSDSSSAADASRTAPDAPGPDDEEEGRASTQRWKFLPKAGTPGYYALLGVVAIFVLGPLGGVTASYMNFSIGFFVGGQVLAGILGSVVTFGYGPSGKHGANYMQTMAASVASMSAMGVLIQAMVWLGMPAPPAWQLVLYFLCIGMFGIGIGMLYTPILVDKLKLTYPSGLAVANILRALTDPRLLRRSVWTLGGGIFSGLGLSKLVDKFGGGLPPTLAAYSSATFGAGMIVGSRISASAIVVGLIGVALTPWLRANNFIGEHDPFRKIGFIFSLGTILGAAIVDMTLLAKDAATRVKAARDEKAAATGQPASLRRLGLWVAFWGVALLIVATQVLNVPPQWVLFAIVMAFVFQMINGISQGITDQNPISSAFVVTVLIMAVLGLRDPLIGLFGGSILLVSCTVGVDMQQDRSTGWRLGSNRSIQFRYQMVGIIMGAVLAVLMTRVFLEAYPILKANLFAHPELKASGEGRAWQSAMTYKFVGILNTLGEDKTRTLSVMGLGVLIGVVIESVRKIVLRMAAYKAWKERNPITRSFDWLLDSLLIASPYASSFGGFVEFETSLWFGLGGIAASLFNWVAAKAKAQRAAHAKASGSPGEGEALPEDMSPTSLVGGGLIAGESLFALWIGLSGLISSGALGKILGGGAAADVGAAVGGAVDAGAVGVDGGAGVVGGADAGVVGAGGK